MDKIACILSVQDKKTNPEMIGLALENHSDK
jgi:hypothetical protein